MIVSNVKKNLKLQSCTLPASGRWRFSDTEDTAQDTGKQLGTLDDNDFHENDPFRIIGDE